VTGDRCALRSAWAGFHPGAGPQFNAAWKNFNGWFQPLRLTDDSRDGRLRRDWQGCRRRVQHADVTAGEVLTPERNIAGDCDAELPASSRPTDRQPIAEGV